MIEKSVMKRVLAIILSLISTSCSQPHSADKDFIDKLLDLTTETSSDEYSGAEYVQLTNLYDTLAHTIPEDKDEVLLLAERLKKRGFEVTNRGRGNFPPLGPRIVIVELKKGNCLCEVSKIYFATVDDNAYQMAEGISCKRTNTK
jgi:hypothetical protein